jgi:hypothetical protein
MLTYPEFRVVAAGRGFDRVAFNLKVLAEQWASDSSSSTRNASTRYNLGGLTHGCVTPGAGSTTTKLERSSFGRSPARGSPMTR